MTWTSRIANSLILKAGLAAAALAGIVVLCAGLLSFTIAKQQIMSAIRGEMDKRAGLIDMRLKSSLDSIAGSLSGIAANTLVGNALVDSTGRDNYLIPFLKSLQSIGGATVRIQLTDYRGRLLAANYAPGEPQHASDICRIAVETNTPQFTLSEQDGVLSGVVVWPVIFANTGLPEGALQYSFTLNQIMGDIFPSTLPNASFRIKAVDADGKREMSALHGEPPPRTALFHSRTIELPQVFDRWRMHVEVWTDQALYLDQLWRLIRGYTLIGIMAMAILAPAGLLVAKGVLSRLQQLERAARTVVETRSLERSFPENGSDEVASLGRVFNIMFRELDQAQRELKSEAGKEIRLHAERLKRVLAQTGEGYLRVDVDRRTILEVNEAFCTVTGQERAQWEGRTVPDYLADLVARAEGVDTAASWKGEEVVIQDAHGTDHHLLTQCSLDIDATGARQLVVFLADVSPLKHAEAALRESEEKFRVMSESSYDAMIMIDANDTVQFWSAASERMFGYAREEALGQKMHLLITPAEYHEAAYRGLHEFARTGQGSAIGTIQEFVARRKDGSTFPVERSVSAFQKGSAWYAVGVIRDITSRMEMDRLKKEFISMVSHELRTPLTSINGALGLLQGGAAGELAPQAKQLLDIAGNNCTRLINLINDILDLEKIESGKMSFRMVQLDLVEVLKASLQDNHALAEHFNVTFTATLPACAVRVMADRDRLGQVMANLLSNAAKFSPPGGVVRISLTQCGDKARVAVQDQGPGVPAAFRDRIFQKFAQADSSDTRQSGGTGLGLNITRSIVERLGGRIDFASEEGNGSTFFFDLPLLGDRFGNGPDDASPENADSPVPTPSTKGTHG